MGYIRHDAIVVTAYRKDHAIAARATAFEFGLAVSDLVESPMNGYVSFLIAPDGSKEGWKDSDDGDAKRTLWLAWADRAQRNEIGPFFQMVHVRYGDDAPSLACDDEV